MKFDELRCSYGVRAEACSDCPFMDLAKDMPDLVTHMKAMINRDGLHHVLEAIVKEDREHDSFDYEQMVHTVGPGPDRYDEGDLIERRAIKKVALCHGIE